MPLILPHALPAFDITLKEGLNVIDHKPNNAKPYRIALLNLMPIKTDTELDFTRVLAQASENNFVELDFMKIAGQTYKNTPQEYVEKFYSDFETFKNKPLDGLIVTGAPIEHLDFEQVRYWKQLTEIFDWAKTHVTTTLYICWGAQAALYHHFGIQKRHLSEKKFGIFKQTILLDNSPIFNGFDKTFPMPHSRHTEVPTTSLKNEPKLTILSESNESGVSLATSNNGQEFYVTGHLEYAPLTLHNEYQRDVKKNLPIKPPAHYYDEKGEPKFSWYTAALQFYRNWVQHYVCKTKQVDYKK